MTRVARAQPVNGRAKRLGSMVEALRQKADIVESTRGEPYGEVAPLECVQGPARAAHAVGEADRPTDREPADPGEAPGLDQDEADAYGRVREDEAEHAGDRVGDAGREELHAGSARQTDRIRRRDADIKGEAEVRDAPEGDQVGSDDERVERL